MRLTEDEVKQGILHADKDVRGAALEYFANSFSLDRTVMPLVIQAFEKFGQADAFPFTYPIADLVQTEATVLWAIHELKRTLEPGDAASNFPYTLSRLLSNADPYLLVGRQAEILAVPGFHHQCVEVLNGRLEMLALDADIGWRELEAICEEGKSKTYCHDFPFERARRIVDSLARHGEQHTDRMMAILGQEITDYANNPLTWMQPLMVQLAGEMRYEPAVPLIVKKLHEDAEVLSEEGGEALTKIGTNSVIEAIRRDFSTAEWHFRLYASSVLGNIHSDFAVEACCALLPNESDYDIRSHLAEALATQFSFEGNELARTVLLDDPNSYDLKHLLVPACTLMKQDFPELDEWRKELEAVTRRQQAMTKQFFEPLKPALEDRPKRRIDERPTFSAPVPEPVRVKKVVGRNDPCPCGSGKKYKTCCLRKNSVR